ncbi:exophilin [Acrasis kona]
MYKCPEKSVSTVRGLSSCTPCNTPSNNQDFCYLEDLPADRKEIFVYTEDRRGDMLLDGTVHLYNFTTKGNVNLAILHLLRSDFTKRNNYDQVTVNVYQKQSQDDVMTLYVSSKTGNPSESNHEQKLTGANATLTIRNNDVEKSAIYVSIEFKRCTYVGIGIQYSNVPIKALVQPNTVTQLEKHNLWSIQTFKLIIPTITQKSLITLAVKGEGEKFKTILMWSKNKQTKQDTNLMNADLVVRGGNNTSITVADQGDVVVTAIMRSFLGQEVAPIVKVQVEPL